jgi:hypothetical protein
MHAFYIRTSIGSIKFSSKTIAEQSYKFKKNHPTKRSPFENFAALCSFN